MLMVSKRKLVIVEGGIASGKSSLSHLLRENMKHSTMLSLSSIYDDSSVYNFLYIAIVKKPAVC